MGGSRARLKGERAPPPLPDAKHRQRQAIAGNRGLVGYVPTKILNPT
ncbi:MAG: hypothetical protein H2174_06160 [Vampirovibrio sp.]|nr:hypothetical protein [Vampirovibrio sp.]